LEVFKKNFIETVDNSQDTSIIIPAELRFGVSIYIDPSGIIESERPRSDANIFV
jgi:hypothetical protein